MAATSSVHTHRCVDHLFRHPLCDDLKLWKKVAIVAFHIFTLGLPLLVYHLVMCCRRGAEAPTQQIIEEIRQPPPPFRYGEEVFDTIHRMLKDHIDQYSLRCIDALHFGSEFVDGKCVKEEMVRDFRQPINQNISRLSAYLDSHFLPRFNKDWSNNTPWWKEGEKEAFVYADLCMKIAYTIGILTIREHKAHCDRHNLSTRKALDDAYPYRTIYFPINIYHLIRQGVDLNRIDDGSFLKRTFPLLRLGRVLGVKKCIKDFALPEEIAAQFYQEGTAPFRWRALFNDYCARVEYLIGNQRVDSRILEWIQPDSSPDSFIPCPTTQPS